MSRASTWAWLGLGVAGSVLLLPARRAARLAAPIDEEIELTEHGAFAAPRFGPPAHEHEGIDIAIPPGAQILAVGDGIIVPSNPGLGGLERKLHLDEPGAWTVWGAPVVSIVYAELGRAFVGEGERVARGAPVGAANAEGFFHFAVKTDDETFIDPMLAGLAYRRWRSEVP